MAHGGARPGSGRPKGSNMVAKDALRKVFEEIAQERWKPMIAAQFDLAIGCLVLGEDSKGEKTVYAQKPDATAARTLIEQGQGKPMQAIDVTSDGERLETTLVIDAKINILRENFERELRASLEE